MSERLEGYMTVPEAAEKYGYSDRTLRYAVIRGTLPAKKVGKTYLVTDEDMQAHVQRTGHRIGYPKGTKRGPRRRQPDEPGEGQ